jgi:3'(2'), 5'-bisphosphate nucleotidase
MNLSILLEKAKQAALKANDAILEIYRSGDFSVESKTDHSPLTVADKASHLVIVNELASTGLPILSEEGRDIPYEERRNWEYFWMIDPIDGTKEFIKRNGEFTVNIALIERNKSVLGVVTVPTTGDMYYASKESGAFKRDNAGSINRLKVSSFSKKTPGLKIVASRSHLNAETKDFIEQLNQPDIVSRGSSLKFTMIAEGLAHIYPRFAPTMEWDTAAAQIIVEEAGGIVEEAYQRYPLTYNKQELLNPYFVVQGIMFD